MKFTLLGLNADFEIIQILNCTNIQWNRKYYEPGDFTLQLPLKYYDSNMVYIYSKDRPELGKILTRKYVGKAEKRYITLSGKFVENELSRMLVYQKPNTTNITNSPAWEFQSGNAEDVALAFFNGFSSLATAGKTISLGITAPTSQHRGETTEHYRDGQDLSKKLYEILKPSGMTYSVKYDLQENTRTLSIWQGLDRTQENEDENNPVTFSTRYGNVINPIVMIDEKSYKNACVVVHEKTENNTKKYTVEAVFNEDTEPGNAMLLKPSMKESEYTAAEFTAALITEGEKALAEKIKVITMDFDVFTGSYEYMEDFDLGDKCNIEIPELNVSANFRLVGCYEVIKDNKWALSLEFDEPEIIS